jgi:hypothetical protein
LKKKLLYYSITYVIVVFVFAIYFAFNLTSYVHLKGDEFIYSLYFMVSTTYLFYIILYFRVLEKSWMLFLLLLFMPLLISVVAFILGFVTMAFFFRGTPVQIVYIYSITYAYLSIGAIVYWLYLKGDLY